MKINEALETYTQALKKQAEFEKEHRKVFENYKVLAETISSTLVVLKETARKYGESVENEVVSVTVSKPREHVWYDLKRIYETAIPSEFENLMNSNAISMEINAGILEKLVKDNQIKLDPSVMHEAFKKEMGNPSVTIKMK
jgi:hypothetical protein